MLLNRVNTYKNTTMLKKLFILFVLLCPSTLWAQGFISEEGRNSPSNPEKKDTLDKNIRLEVFYLQTDVDTVIPSTQANPMVLGIGESFMTYRSYGAYRRDSLYVAKGKTPTWGEVLDLDFIYPNTPNYHLVRNLKSKMFTESFSVFPSRYRCLDSTAVFQWTLLPDTATVCGYLCHKATAPFRGRVWTAWWSDEIPIDAGPWKLQGLPGLILKAQDDKGTHHIEATSIHAPRIKFLTISLHRWRKVTREAALKAIYEDATHPGAGMVAAGLIEKKEPEANAKKRRHFYSPYEDF